MGVKLFATFQNIDICEINTRDYDIGIESKSLDGRRLSIHVPGSTRVIGIRIDFWKIRIIVSAFRIWALPEHDPRRSINTKSSPWESYVLKLEDISRKDGIERT